MRATCCVEPSMNSSPASSYAFASSSSSRSARRAVISPIRSVSILEPALERRIPGTDDHAVVLPRKCEAAVADRNRGPAAHLRKLALVPGDLRPGHAHRLRRYRLVENVDPPEQVAELEAPEHLAQLRPVRRQQHELGRIAVELEVAPHRRQLL